MRWRVLVSVCAVLALSRCTIEEQPEGTQTNWGTCEVDGQCDEGFVCVERHCAPEITTGAADAGSGTVGGGGAGGSGSELEGGTGVPSEAGQGGSSFEFRSFDECFYLMSLTDEEWEGCIALRPGEVDVDACEITPAEPDALVKPFVACYSSSEDPVPRCGVEPYCTSHEECTEGPRGRCRGVLVTWCWYPGMDEVLDRTCTSAADCGSEFEVECPWSDAGPSCYPDGECAEHRCAPVEVPCSMDGDCAAHPGGVCKKEVWITQCHYDKCHEDADCAESERCACYTCVPSGCEGDGDCGAGQTCRSETGCFDEITGYHCTTSLDECGSSADCVDERLCEHAVDRWQCAAEACQTFP